MMSKERKEFNLEQYDLGKFESMASDENASLGAIDEPITKAQQTTVYSLFGQLNLDKADLGIEKISSLTKMEATQLIDELFAMKVEQEDKELEDEFLEYYGDIGEDLSF